MVTISVLNVVSAIPIYICSCHRSLHLMVASYTIFSAWQFPFSGRSPFLMQLHFCSFGHGRFWCKTFLLWQLMIDFMFFVQFQLTFRVFLLKILCSLWCREKCLIILKSNDHLLLPHFCCMVDWTILCSFFCFFFCFVLFSCLGCTLIWHCNLLQKAFSHTLGQLLLILFH